jgi:hypothetical protein
VVQSEHHNYQEAVPPLLVTRALLEEQWLPQGTLHDPLDLQFLFDNRTVVAVVNKLRTRSLKIAALMSPWIREMHQQSWRVRAEHVDKMTMDTEYTVDQEGRRKSAWWERGIPHQTFRQVVQTLGIHPNAQLIDMFSTREVKQSNKWVSDPTEKSRDALWIDALNSTHKWNHMNPRLPKRFILYLNPPLRLLEAALRRLNQDSCTSALLVTPFTSRSLMQDISRMQVVPLCFFVVDNSDLIPPEGWQHASELPSHPRTYIAAILSACVCEREGGRKSPLQRLLREGILNPEQVQSGDTILHGHDGLISSRAKDYILSAFRRQHYQTS